MEKRVAKIFNGTYTVASPGDPSRGLPASHRTFDISTQKKDAKFAPGQRIISLLTGPDNTRDYKGFGFVTNNGISIWGKARGTELETMARMVWSLAVEGEKSQLYGLGYRLLSEGACIRCNRKLTHPQSLKTGIGPECAKRG